jgi:hypothetical protein
MSLLDPRLVQCTSLTSEGLDIAAGVTVDETADVVPKPPNPVNRGACNKIWVGGVFYKTRADKCTSDFVSAGAGVVPNPVKVASLGLGAALTDPLAMLRIRFKLRLTDDELEEAADVESGVAPLRLGRPLILWI